MLAFLVPRLSWLPSVVWRLAPGPLFGTSWGGGCRLSVFRLLPAGCEFCHPEQVVVDRLLDGFIEGDILRVRRRLMSHQTLRAYTRYDLLTVPLFTVQAYTLYDLLTVLLFTVQAYTGYDLSTVFVFTVQAYTQYDLLTVLLFTVQAYTGYDLLTVFVFTVRAYPPS